MLVPPDFEARLVSTATTPVRGHGFDFDGLSVLRHLCIHASAVYLVVVPFKTVVVQNPRLYPSAVEAGRASRLVAHTPATPLSHSIGTARMSWSSACTPVSTSSHASATRTTAAIAPYFFSIGSPFCVVFCVDSPDGERPAPEPFPFCPARFSPSGDPSQNQFTNPAHARIKMYLHGGR